MAFARQHDWSLNTRFREDHWNDETAEFRRYSRGVIATDFENNVFGPANLAQPYGFGNIYLSAGDGFAINALTISAYDNDTDARESVIAEYRLIRDLYITSGWLEWSITRNGSGNISTLFQRAEIDIVTETPGSIRPDPNRPYTNDDDARLLPHSSILSAPISMLGNATGTSGSRRIHAQGNPILVVDTLPRETLLKVIMRLQRATGGTGTPSVQLEVVDASFHGGYIHSALSG